MDVSFYCPGCARPMTAAPNLVGRRGACRKCGSPFTIPGQMPAEADRPCEQESKGPAVRYSPVLVVAAAPGALLFLVWASIYPALFLLVLLPLGWALVRVAIKVPRPVMAKVVIALVVVVVGAGGWAWHAERKRERKEMDERIKQSLWRVDQELRAINGPPTTHQSLERMAASLKRMEEQNQDQP